jgi:pantoate--beta-alanine ligase
MTLELKQDVRTFRAACDDVRRQGGVLGLVPTMGALHEGHMSLVRMARARASTVAVTIFVNPTQFGPGEDLARYPRTLEQDLNLCREAGVGLVFSPDASEMYPPRERTRVRVSGLTDALCGPRRPGHFEGVATVVSKLFNVAGPCLAVFGRKDYQQLKVIERMVRDLLLPIEIVSHPTVRDPDGLAMSSRNRYLTPAEREAALSIPRALGAAIAAFQAGERRARALRAPVADALSAAGLRIDYAELTDADELEPFSDEAGLGSRALLAIAAFAGNTRLIDNVVLGEDPAPELGRS